ncbi:MAG: hypothetical protein LVS60_07410 [Nodosilinea sp. LVE1205-7]|jgi:hypothetical protein
MDIAPEIVQLTSNRAALVAENALYRTQLGEIGRGSPSYLSPSAIASPPPARNLPLA